MLAAGYRPTISLPPLFQEDGAWIPTELVLQLLVINPTHDRPWGWDPHSRPPVEHSSLSDLNATPRPTTTLAPRPPATANTSPRPKRPPLKFGGRPGQLDNTVGAALPNVDRDPPASFLTRRPQRTLLPTPHQDSPGLHTVHAGLLPTGTGLTTLKAPRPSRRQNYTQPRLTPCAPNRESPQDQPHSVPHRAAPVRDSPHALHHHMRPHAGPSGSPTRPPTHSNRDTGTPRPKSGQGQAASPRRPPTRLRTIRDQYWARQPRGTPSGPVGTEQLQRPHPSWELLAAPRRAGLPEEPFPYIVLSVGFGRPPPPGSKRLP